VGAVSTGSRPGSMEAGRGNGRRYDPIENDRMNVQELLYGGIWL